MPIGLISGASIRSQFLLEDIVNFKIVWTSNSPTPRIRIRIALAVETKGYLFLGKWIIAPSPATHIKLGAIVLIAFCCFCLLPSHLPLSSPFTISWLTPLFMPPLLLLPIGQHRWLGARLRGGKHCDGNLFFSNPWHHKNGGRGNPRTHRLLQEDDRDSFTVLISLTPSRKALMISMSCMCRMSFLALQKCLT
jgi:hypothetical protein